MRILFVIILLFVPNRAVQVSSDRLKFSLIHTIDFIAEKYKKIGFDGAFGLTLAEAQLNKLLHLSLVPEVQKDVEFLISKSRNTTEKLLPLLPTQPEYMITFRNLLLDSNRWSKTMTNTFSKGDIVKLGMNINWTVEKVLQQKEAVYKGVKSDKCMREILEMSPPNGYCYVSNICFEMMLDNLRIDTGYLLTHRLLYLQIQRLKGCKLPDYISTTELSRKFCSYIYKEAITNEYLGFPYHDIFMEQVVLCGMEGYAEFMAEKWMTEIMNWQNPHGCYESIARNLSKRTSILIDYGCSDHSTGLGAAALALYFRYGYTSFLQNLDMLDLPWNQTM